MIIYKQNTAYGLLYFYNPMINFIGLTVFAKSISKIFLNYKINQAGHTNKGYLNDMFQLSYEYGYL